MENPNASSPEQSVTAMMTVIDNLTMENNGQFVNYEDGAVIGW
jgi:hypothetical protein